MVSVRYYRQMYFPIIKLWAEQSQKENSSLNKSDILIFNLCIRHFHGIHWAKIWLAEKSKKYKLFKNISGTK